MRRVTALIALATAIAIGESIGAHRLAPPPSAPLPQAPRLEGQAMRTTRLPRDVEISLALNAGPAHLRSAAAVYVFGAAGYELARKGTSEITCLVNRDAFLDNYDALKPTCFDPEGTARIVPMILREGRLIAKGADAATIRKDIESAFAAGELKPPSRTGVAYMLEGDVSALDAGTGAVLARSHPPHLMFYAAGLTNADFGFGASPIDGLASPPFVYRRNQYHGYVIVTPKR
jgi:hypothetical protein